MLLQLLPVRTWATCLLVLQQQLRPLVLVLPLLQEAQAQLRQLRPRACCLRGRSARHVSMLQEQEQLVLLALVLLALVVLCLWLLPRVLLPPVLQGAMVCVQLAWTPQALQQLLACSWHHQPPQMSQLRH